MQKRFDDFQSFSDGESGDDDYNEESDKKGSKRSAFQKSKATIYMVDARRSMFTDSGMEDIPFLLSLKCIRSAIRNKIFKNESAYAGLILLGTGQADNYVKLENINVVQPLKRLAADHILKIDEICKAVNDSTYEKVYGIDNFNLADALWLSSKIFSEQKINIHKTIVLFTNDDDPLVGNTNAQKRAITTVTDMAQNSIVFDLVHLGKNFDCSKFYNEVVQVSKNDFMYDVPSPCLTMKEMLERISKVHLKHMTLTKLPFYITDDFICGVSVHHLARERKPPYIIKLSKSTNEKVTSKVQHFESETGEVVKEENLIKARTIGNQEVFFKKEELKEMSEIGDRGLKLLGFKPASVIKLEQYVKSCGFIYPDDSQYKGSSLFLATLLKRCIVKQVVAICTYNPRISSDVRFVALLAQEEVLGDNKQQLSPPGFLVIHLPFAEEIRDLDEHCTGKRRADPEKVDVAKKLIKKLKFNYKPELFSNPKIQYHWAAVEALALELPSKEEVKDNTVPNYAGMNERTKDVAEDFNNAMYPEDYNPFEDLKTKVKLTSVDNNEVERLVKQGKEKALTIEKLKVYLKNVGLGQGLSSMKKDQLVKKVSDYIQNSKS